MVYILPAVIGLLIPTVTSRSIPSPQQVLDSWTTADTELCPLARKVHVSDGFISPLRYVEDDSFRLRQVNRLSRAVQVPTAVSDFMKDPYDEGFAPFLDFHDLLETLFPLIHSHARIDHINRLGLVYTLNGTDTTLKPLLFTAHQDVVPINDPSDWTHPPFAGHFDGEWLWGRGASDCKNVLIGLLSAVEDLLHQNWQPTRTVVLAFGFDEEAHGFLGAGSIAKFLEAKYGRDSFEFVLDEGGMGLETLTNSNSNSATNANTKDENENEDNIVYALPGVGEKGSLDMVITLDTPGGHSSVPPAHTSIGILSSIIHTLEHEDLFTPLLSDSHPSRRKLECQVAHSPHSTEPWLAAALNSPDHASLASKLALSRGSKFRFTLQTSQAADMVSGGVKSNALPEKATAVINYRVALHQTPTEIQDRAIRLITPIASAHNLTTSFFPPSNIPNESGVQNHLSLTTLSPPLSPAPLSPTGMNKDRIWTRFAGTARSVFEAVPSLKGKTVVVAGDVMTGNTDTRFYWNLTGNVYRWGPVRAGRALNIHTVDERIGIDAHLEGMALYYELIRAFDKWDDQDETEERFDL